MLRERQQNEYVILALFGGLALVLLSGLGYMALWRRRRPEVEGAAAFGRWVRSDLPWAPVVTYVATIVFMGRRPTGFCVALLPNW